MGTRIHSDWSCRSNISLKREGSRVIHELTGVEILREETSVDVMMMAKAMSSKGSDESHQAAPCETGKTASPVIDMDAAAETSYPIRRHRSRGCCLPCRTAAKRDT